MPLLIQVFLASQPILTCFLIPFKTIIKIIYEINTYFFLIHMSKPAQPNSEWLVIHSDLNSYLGKYNMTYMYMYVTK